MEFKEAFNMVKGIHSTLGDSNFANWWDEAKSAVEKYNTFTEWVNSLPYRTDLSDDDRWDIEIFEDSFKVLFALMGKPG